MKPTPSNTELQLRFILEPEDLAQLANATFAAAETAEPAHKSAFSATYYDGAEHPLGNSNITLHVEKAGGRYVQHLESRVRGLGAATLCRKLESPIPNSYPVLSGVDDGNLRQALAGYAGDPLEPVYRTDLERTTRRLILKDGSALTADLDVGEVAASTARKPISELTLRLESGPRYLPFELALELLQKGPLRIATQSRARRGAALASGETPGSSKAAALDLSRDSSVEGALIHTAQHCLDHLLANEACILDSEDPEGVHQMRVALRRFRSALRLFRPLLPTEQYTWLNTESKHLTDQLAAARDWDVFADEIVAPAMTQLSGEMPFEVFQERIARHREERRHAARNALLAQRYTEFLLRLSLWLTKRVWRDQPLSEQAAQIFGPIRPFATANLAKLHKRVEKMGRIFDRLSVPERHQMRIHVKRLRYAIDFFSSLFPRKAVKGYGEALAGLQDSLGYLNDVAVAEELVARTCEGAEGKDLEDCRFVGGVVIGWHARGVADSESALVANVKTFVASTPFWTNSS